MKPVEKGDVVTISHKFGQKGYDIVGVVVTPPVGNAHSLPYMEVFNQKNKRIYLKNILAITPAADHGKEAFAKR
jgi:hypothetical protein